MNFHVWCQHKNNVQAKHMKTCCWKCNARSLLSTKWNSDGWNIKTPCQSISTCNILLMVHRWQD